MLQLGQGMKTRLLIALGVVLLAGCDDKSQSTATIPTKNILTIAEMITKGKEDITSECNKKETSLNCEFLTPNLTNLGQWHHTKVVLYKGKEAVMIIDGKEFSLSTFDAIATAEQETIIFAMKNTDGEKGDIKIVSSDRGKLLSFNAYRADNKHLTASSVKLK